MKNSKKITFQSLLLDQINCNAPYMNNEGNPYYCFMMMKTKKGFHTIACGNAVTPAEVLNAIAESLASE